MRNISFALTTEQFVNETKDVTRRLGWQFLKAGDRLMGVEKAQGIKKGELVRLGVIEVVNVSRDGLYSMICPCSKNESRCPGCREAVREGFPEMTGRGFVKMFCEHMKCDPSTEVTRIEFKYIYSVYDMHDGTDWVVARCLDEAKRFYQSEIEVDEQDLEEARELTSKELADLQFWDTEDRDPQGYHHWRCECGEMADAECRWNGFAYEHHHGYPIGHVRMENIHCRSFAKQLERRLQEGLKGADWFAVSEF